MDPRRHVPRTDVVLADPRLVAARERLGGALVKAVVAGAQELARSGAIGPEAVADVAADALPPIAATLTPVINATGVLVHTNLGRARTLQRHRIDAAARPQPCLPSVVNIPQGGRVGGGRHAGYGRDRG